MIVETDGWDWVTAPHDMTADAAALLNVIADAGDDDTPRLVYADHLEETGRSDWAQFLRRQCDDLNKAEGERPVKVVMPHVMGYRVGDPTRGTAFKNGNRVTVEKLLLTGPWHCGDYSRWFRYPDYNLAAVEIESEGYRTKSITVFPRFFWYRGFLSAFTHVSALKVFKFARSGAHAWHPWDATPDCIDPTAAGFIQSFYETDINAQPHIDVSRHGIGPPYYLTVARRHKGAKRWDIAGADWHGLTINSSLEIIPEPITRFLSSTDTEPRGHFPHRYYYRTWTEALSDLNRAARTFLRESARIARNRVLSIG